MRYVSSARALYRQLAHGLAWITRRPQPSYRPLPTDRAFMQCLPEVSAQLRAAKAALLRGDDAEAARQVVDHFLQRPSPRFFVDPARIGPLASRLRLEKPAFVSALREEAETELRVGLRVLAHRGPASAGGFDWRRLGLPQESDILYRVHPHRYGFMPLLGLAAHHGLAALRVIADLTERWMALARSGDAMCYLSPLVVLYRVVASSWTFAFVAGLDPARHPERHAVLFRILSIVQADCDYLKDVIGHSYPNNHLLADGFAGWYCGTLYPEFPAAEALKRQGEPIFLHELQRQFYDDGAGFEHSTHYHELGCEMATAFVLLSRRNGVEPPADVLARHRQMLAFQSALCGPEAVALPIGDSTEDPLFPLDSARGWAGGAMRELYRTLYDDSIEGPPSTDVTVERAWWLLGDVAPQGARAAQPGLPKAFEQGGFYVLEDDALNARLVFRTGPVARLPISAGHAHADLLGIYLGVGGLPLIVSAGTYTYRFGKGRDAQPDWRSYFAGPAAHNGLIFSDDPYGPLQGDFRARDVPCRVVSRQHGETAALTWREFEVTGESVAAGHRRGIVHVIGRYWLVYDVVPPALQTAGVQMALQFAPATAANMLEANVLELKLQGSSCSIGLGTTLEAPVVLSGSLTPPAGWVSPRYGEKVAAPQLRARLRLGAGPWGFVLKPNVQDAVCSIVDCATTGGYAVFTIAEGACVDTLLVRARDTGSAHVGDVDFAGSLLWLRMQGSEMAELRSIGDEPVRWRGRQVSAL